MSLHDLSICVQMLNVLIADWPIRLDTCQISGTRKTRHFRKRLRFVLFVFFGCYGRPRLFLLSQAMTRGERSVKRKRSTTQIVQGPLKALLLSLAP